MNDAQELQTFLEALTKGQSAYGWLGLVAALLTMGVRVLRLGAIQKALGAVDERLTWARWKKPTRLGVVFLLSAGGSILTAILGGISWPAASVSALLAALTAIGLNETTEGVGQAVAPAVPTPIRPAIGLLIPMPKVHEVAAAMGEEVTTPGGP